VLPGTVVTGTPARGSREECPELLRLMDATSISCAQSVVTARRSNLYGYAG
jgi:hypothetical protein